MQIGREWSEAAVSKRSPGNVNLCLRGHKVGRGLISGYSLSRLFCCYLERKRWCGGPFGLLFDFVFLFPSEPHLLRQSRSQVQRGRAGVGGGLGGKSS